MTIERIRYEYWMGRCTQILFTLPWLMVVLITGHYLTERYSIGIDDQKELCLTGHHRWYLIDHWDRSFKANDLMAFGSDQRMQPFFKPETTFVKAVQGLPGQFIDQQGDTIRVDQKTIGIGFPLLNHAGVQNAIHGEIFRLQPTTYWVMGDQPKSFDSRYWGVVYSQQIIGKAYALPF